MDTIIEQLMRTPSEVGKFYLDHCLDEYSLGNKTGVNRLSRDMLMYRGNIYRRYGTDFLDSEAEKVFYALGLIE